jgi:predicted acylesterase/phospholipase RssA
MSKLKLGFAMGGGVSLGTFNGSALTQSIKLLIAYSEYDEIEIDVFSGASAGALALGSMMSGLISGNFTEGQRKKALKEIESEFQAVYPNLPEKKKKQLLDAQLLQNEQERLWGKEVNLDRLLRMNEPHKRRALKSKGSILDRGVVDEISADLIERNLGNFKPSELAAERILFVNTLTNLNSVTDDARHEFDGESYRSEISKKTLNDALTSFRHQETRVFDIHLAELSDETLAEDRHPQRWMRYHLGAEIRAEMDGQGEYVNKGAFDLTLRESWSEIFSTMIACGAFPGAFEPVSLRRHRFEYSKATWNNNYSSSKDSTISTYIDGGTLNNEPIREAFRLASFLDAEEPDENFKRLIIFADPAVSDIQKDRENIALRQKSMAELGRVFKGRNLMSLDKLPGHLVSVVGLLMNQARSQEADKYLHIRQKFRERAKVRKYYGDKFRGNPSDFTVLRNHCAEILEKDRMNHLLPANSVNLGVEVQRIINEEKGNHPEFAGIPVSDVQKIHEDPDFVPTGNLDALFTVLSFLAFDLQMDLSGKREIATLVGMGPIDQNGKPDSLPGGAVSGFAGFTSTVPSQFEFEMGEYAAHFFLSEAGLLKEAPGAKCPAGLTKAKIEQYKRDFRIGMSHLADRAKEMIKESHLKTDQSFFPELVLDKVADKVRDFIAGIELFPRKTRRFQLSLDVPNKHLEVDTDHEMDNDIVTHKSEDGYQILVELDYDLENDLWLDEKQIMKKGNHLRVDYDPGAFNRTREMYIRLPSPELVKKARALNTPFFRIPVTLKGKTLGQGEWEIGQMARPLEL